MPNSRRRWAWNASSPVVTLIILAAAATPYGQPGDGIGSGAPGSPAGGRRLAGAEQPHRAAGGVRTRHGCRPARGRPPLAGPCRRARAPAVAVGGAVDAGRDPHRLLAPVHRPPGAGAAAGLRLG